METGREVQEAVTKEQAGEERGLGQSGDDRGKLKDWRCVSEVELAGIFWHLICKL